ncbi:hypothetical protein SRRS_36030 [Sporomusa rhizae]
MGQPTSHRTVRTGCPRPTMKHHCNEKLQKAIRPRCCHGCCQIAIKTTKKALRKYRKTLEISMATPAGFEPATF